MEKFTPGPWYANGNGVWRSDTHNSVAFVTPYKPDLSEGEECASTARLIAHSPEMYAAMKEFCVRVEIGEVKSKKTYALFKDILARINPENKQGL